MNKLLPVLFLLLSCVVSAEELKFITVLSSPVGAFNKLEAVDPTSAAQGTKVNFCTSLGNGGTVELKGAKDASLGNVNLDSATTLGRTSDGDYVLTNITLNSGGSVEGSRLLSNVVNINGSAVGKSDNLHSSTLTVAGAKTTGLNVNNKSIMSGTGSAEEMVWSNEYQSDTACGTNCAKQYLLKEKMNCDASGAGACTSSGGTWDNGLCGCVCPANMVLQNGRCVGGFKPKVIDVGVLVNCHYCPDSYYKKCSEVSDPNDSCHSWEPEYSGQSCQHGGSASKESYCVSRLRVNSYEFYIGGSLETGGTGGSGCTGMAIFWKGGSRIGGQLVGYPGRSMPNCSGSDYQSLCDRNCTPGSSSCTYKCLISKTDSGCSNGCYHCSNGWHDNNGSGTGKVLTCVKS